MPRQQDFNWAANNRRYASPEDKARHDAARGISTIPVPPNLEPHEIPDDPYGPGWDESARLAAYDKHNNYSSDHDYDGFNTWNRVPDPVGPMPPPLHIPKTEKEMEQYWPFKNDKIGDYEAAAGIMLDMERDEDTRRPWIKNQDEERWKKYCVWKAQTYADNGEPLQMWGENCGVWTCCEPTEAEEAAGWVTMGEGPIDTNLRRSPRCDLGIQTQEEADAEQERRRIWRQNNWSQEPDGK